MISVHVLSVKNNNLMRFAVHNIKKTIEALYNFSKKKIPGHFHGIIDQKFNTSTFAFLNKNVKQTSLYILKKPILFIARHSTMFLLHTKIEVQSRTKYYYIKIQIPQPPFTL